MNLKFLADCNMLVKACSVSNLCADCSMNIIFQMLKGQGSGLLGQRVHQMIHSYKMQQEEYYRQFYQWPCPTFAPPHRVHPSSYPCPCPLPLPSSLLLLSSPPFALVISPHLFHTHTLVASAINMSHDTTTSMIRCCLVSPSPRPALIRHH